MKDAQRARWLATNHLFSLIFQHVLNIPAKLSAVLVMTLSIGSDSLQVPGNIGATDRCPGGGEPFSPDHIQVPLRVKDSLSLSS